MVDGALHDALAVGPQLHVAGDEMQAVARVQFIDRALRLGGVAPVDDHLCPLIEEGLGDGQPNTSRTACDAGDASVEYPHGEPPSAAPNSAVES